VTGTLSSGSPFALVTVTLKGTENLVPTIPDCGDEACGAVTVSGAAGRLVRSNMAGVASSSPEADA
jgi:hypothetical protein